MGDFKKLVVWKKAKDLAVYIYKLTDKGRFGKDFGLRDQIRRASVSISSNIAEGEELGTNRQIIRHFYIAKGSGAELLTQAIIANEINYLSNEEFKHIETESILISKMLYKLIQARSITLEEPLPPYPEP